MAVAAVAAVGIPLAGALAFRTHVQRRIGHILHGHQRRELHPIEIGVGPGALAMQAAEDVSITRDLYTLKDGSKHFCQVVRPTKTKPSYILVFFHGYTSNSDLYVEPMCELARQGAMVVLPDLPCHGRSDGLLCYTPDWWAWIADIWELIDIVIPPLRQEEFTCATPRLFVAGISLGGGLTACLALQRPTFFDGMLLVAPMLFISDAIKPPKIVQQVFKNVLGPFKLTWPITPVKEMADFDFRIREQGHRFTLANPFSMQGLKVRLGTAKELGFTFPEYLEANLSKVSTPFIVFHGLADKITDPDMSKRLYNEASATDKDIKLYEGAYHCELLCCMPGTGKMIDETWLPEQSAQTETCLKDMADWLVARA